MTAASTVTALPEPQWRIMNRLNSRTGKPATAVLERCDADVDDLIALADRELVRGLLDDAEVDLGLIAHDRGLLNDYDIRIAHTPAGARWVAENPSNRALIVLDNGRRQAKLTDAAAKAEIDAALYLLLEHAGLVEFFLPNGHDIRPVGTTTLAFYRKSLHVKLTAKAVGIVG